MIKKVLKKILARLRGELNLKKLQKRGLQVGDRFKLMGESIIDPSHCWHIEIGNDVTFAPRVHILAHDASTKTHLGYTRIANVRIGDRVFIGAGAIVLPGVTIGDDVIVGAGSVVTKDIPSGTLAAGSPARKICTTEEYLSSQQGKMNPENCFGASFTIPFVTDDQKSHMKVMAEKHKQAFVI